MFSKLGFFSASRSQGLISRFTKQYQSNAAPIRVNLFKRFCSTATTPPPNRNFITPTIRDTLTLRNNNQYRRFNGKEGVRLLGASGFSLGFLGLFEKKEKLSPEDELLMKIKRAVLAIQEQELSKAERHLADAWKMSDKLDREDVKTQIMDIQANIAFKKGELDKAVRLFQLVSQRMIYHQGVKATENSIVEISIKLAQIYAMKGQENESMAGFKYCADTQREKINQGVNDEDTLMLAAWALQSLAQAYMAFGTREEVTEKVSVSKAAEYMKEAYKYANEAVGPESQQVIAISTDLAAILAMEGDVDEALRQLQEIDKIAAEKYHYLQAAIRVNTGSLYLQKGNYSEAQRVCREAKMIAGIFKDQESVMRADECISKSDSLKNDTELRNRTKTKIPLNS